LNTTPNAGFNAQKSDFELVNIGWYVASGHTAQELL